MKDGKWKIADFGLSTEATSKHARTTIFANGTPCYRAPELLNENPNFTNKVDIWALGCIVYELFFEKRIFATEWDVNAYHTSESLLAVPPIIAEEPNGGLQSHVSGLLRDLLHRNWENRPRSSVTSMTFCSYAVFSHPVHLRTVLGFNRLPLYSE